VHTVVALEQWFGVWIQIQEYVDVTIRLHHLLFHQFVQGLQMVVRVQIHCNHIVIHSLGVLTIYPITAVQGIATGQLALIILHVLDVKLLII